MASNQFVLKLEPLEEICEESISEFDALLDQERAKNVQIPHSVAKDSSYLNLNSEERPFACKRCGQSFKKHNHLKTHQRIHTGERPFKCKWCDKRYNRSTNLTRHERTHMGENHLVPKLEPQETISEFDALLAPQEKGLFGCSQCELAFTSEDLLQEHTCKKHEGRNFPCPVCAYLAKNKPDLKAHERLVHRGVGRKRNHVCPHCNKAFAMTTDLANHMRTHTGETPFVCNVCAKGFAQKGNLDRHKLTHSGERPFACKECGKRFSLRGNLSTHQRTHYTGEKPYKCNWCDKGFKQSITLNKHEARHALPDPESAKDVFSCSQCDLAFASEQFLKEHTRKKHETHTGEEPFVCDVCSKGFNLKSTLMQHQLIHSAEHPFECKECGRRFDYLSQLKRHQRIHMPEKPYKCSWCSYRAAVPSYLRTHQRRMHQA